MAGSKKDEKQTLTIGSWDRFVIQRVKAAEMTKEQAERLEKIIVQEVKTATGKDPNITRIQDSVIIEPQD